ncbi:unnamed protein product [Protopolystoma xenopodis]|uniref:Uncharacterized protein n=1 Tax=Protopolystoma xenopodis TaxID=117903 RepID=A0A3S4ZZD3_9PLAT|nr:unnamed protein product [Protopolystoma xenopodis]
MKYSPDSPRLSALSPTTKPILGQSLQPNYVFHRQYLPAIVGTEAQPFYQQVNRPAKIPYLEKESKMEVTGRTIGLAGRNKIKWKPLRSQISKDHSHSLSSANSHLLPLLRYNPEYYIVDLKTNASFTKLYTSTNMVPFFGRSETPLQPDHDLRRRGSADSDAYLFSESLKLKDPPRIFSDVEPYSLHSKALGSTGSGTLTKLSRQLRKLNRSLGWSLEGGIFRPKIALMEAKNEKNQINRGLLRVGGSDALEDYYIDTFLSSVTSQNLVAGDSKIIGSQFSKSRTDARGDWSVARDPRSSSAGKERQIGPVCGLDPDFCLDPQSVGAFAWSLEDVTKWPVSVRPISQISQLN